MDSRDREMLQQVAKTLGIKFEQTYVAEVVKTGDKIILPENAHIPDIIKMLERQWAMDSTDIMVAAQVNVPPWDGAAALTRAIEQELGMAIQNEEVIQTMFGTIRKPAGSIEVEYEYGKTVTVQWGEFALPGMGDNAKANTGMAYDAESVRWQFQCTISCKQAYRKRAEKVLEAMRKFAMTESLHRGKAFSLRFIDDDGDRIQIPKPTFFPLDVAMPIFRSALERAIDRNVFVPLRFTQQLQAMGESLKRGCLFAGEYGTGKTMLAAYIARECVANGWTFIYCKNSLELPLALREGLRLQPAVVFAEDVDRVAGSERTEQVQGLLNQLDGVDSKTAKIMTILTSNDANEIHPAMKRPGRIDLLMKVEFPDAETVGRMVRSFARGSLVENADLTAMTETLAGLSPSHVKETVGRARLEALRRTGDPDAPINGEDLLEVAIEVKAETEMFKQHEEAPVHEVEALAEGLEKAGAVMRKVVKGNGSRRATHTN